MQCGAVGEQGDPVHGGVLSEAWCAQQCERQPKPGRQHGGRERGGRVARSTKADRYSADEFFTCAQVCVDVVAPRAERLATLVAAPRLQAAFKVANTSAVSNMRLGMWLSPSACMGRKVRLTPSASMQAWVAARAGW